MSPLLSVRETGTGYNKRWSLAKARLQFEILSKITPNARINGERNYDVKRNVKVKGVSSKMVE